MNGSSGGFDWVFENESGRWRCRDCGFLWCIIGRCDSCTLSHDINHQKWRMQNGIVSSSMKLPRIVFCPLCENKFDINMTGHICPDTSKDWLDVMARIK